MEFGLRWSSVQALNTKAEPAAKPKVPLDFESAQPILRGPKNDHNVLILSL